MSSPRLRIRCQTPEEARCVVCVLLGRSVPAAEIEVLSAEPIHDLAEAISGKSRLPAFVLAGAAVGTGAGASMAAVTARMYPINTGGMPIVSPLPVGIVTYEAMMLLAILFTLAGLVLEARLLRRRPRAHEIARAEIADGEIHVLVRVASEAQAGELRAAVEAGCYGSET